MKINNFEDKDLIDLPENHSDERGFIQPLCDLEMKSASLLYSKKNTWRANHHHKSDWHFIYVLEGGFDYYYRKTNSNEKIKKKTVKKNQLLYTGPLVDHAMLYTEETKLLVVSKNPRDQKTYEEDTVRIDFMNDNNKF